MIRFWESFRMILLLYLVKYISVCRIDKNKWATFHQLFLISTRKKLGKCRWINAICVFYPIFIEKHFTVDQCKIHRFLWLWIRYYFYIYFNFIFLKHCFPYSRCVGTYVKLKIDNRNTKYLLVALFLKEKNFIKSISLIFLICLSDYHQYPTHLMRFWL